MRHRPPQRMSLFSMSAVLGWRKGQELWLLLASLALPAQVSWRTWHLSSFLSRPNLDTTQVGGCPSWSGPGPPRGLEVLMLPYFLLVLCWHPNYNIHYRSYSYLETWPFHPKGWSQDSFISGCPQHRALFALWGDVQAYFCLKWIRSVSL
jgi:hypothetical protein